MEQKLFNCKFPIIEALMNRASNIELALAVKKAGAFPSLFANQFSDIDKARLEIEKFIDKSGDSTVTVNVTKYDFINYKKSDSGMIQLLNEYKITNCEIFPSDSEGNVNYDFLEDPMFVKAVECLKRTTKITLRVYEPVDFRKFPYIDCLSIKGQESAGKTGNWKVQDLFMRLKEISPDIPLIPMGGVGTPDQVRWYIDQGAVAVGIGTFFAACTESPLSREVKQKMIESSSKDIIKLDDTKQNCIIFNENKKLSDRNKINNWNRDDSLAQGVFGNGNQGHIYVGAALDQIDRIRTVQESVDYLTCLL
jgi:hypothetical protein